jgi:endonuclease/exonuclease/phosphatase (EEP) superfamily protein YafD
LNLLKLLAGLGLIILALSHLGRWLAMGDSLSVGRVQLLVAGAVLVVVFRIAKARHFARWTGSAVLASALQTGWLWYGPATGAPGGFVLYQKNMLFLNSRHPQLIADIRESGAMVVTLQEVAERNLPVLEALSDLYPYQKVCAFAGVGGTAILSQRPFVGGTQACGDKDGLTIAQIVVPQGPLWIASLHLHWPWPYGQQNFLPRITERLAALEGPVVLGGDFNMQAWGASVAEIARAVGASRIGTYGSTFPQFTALVPMIIDQVLVPDGASGTVERRPLLGSDHMGLLARITLPGQR